GEVLAVAGDSVAVGACKDMQRRLADVGARMRTDLDLPGTIWPDRPALPLAPVFAHDPVHATTPRADKLKRVRQAMRKLGASHHLLLQPDDRATLFVQRSKLDDALVAALAADGIGIADYASTTSTLAELDGSDSLLLDENRIVCTISAAVAPGVKQIQAANPSTAFKAIKTSAELDHIREVMRRDGTAL